MAELPQYLLLLPPPPWPATAQSVQAAYEEPLSSVLKQLAFEPHKKVKGAKLDVALPVPYLYEHLSRPRASLYHTTQIVLAQVYRLIYVIAARENINVEDAEGIDARIVLVARPRHDEAPQGQEATNERRGLVGVVVDMPTLSRSNRPWEKIFSVESEDGEDVLKQFLRHQDSRVKTQRVGGGIVQVGKADKDDEAAIEPEAHHKSVIVGGTWDHIHIGHKLLLTMFAFMLEAGEDEDDKVRSLFIGITGDELLVNKKFAEHLQDWNERKESTLSFLRAIMDFRPASDASVKSEEINEPGPNGHAINVWLTPRLVIHLVEISDPYGPTITVEDITAIVISAETRAGGKAVNEKRAERGWHQLLVLEVDVLDATEDQSQSQSESFESKLSSTTIRKAISERAQIRAKA